MSNQAVPLKEPEKIIISLRESIPTVLCKYLCSDCCGAVPWSHWEWNQLPNFLKKGLVVNEVYVKPPNQGLYRKAVIPLRYKLNGSSTISLWSRNSWMEMYTARPIKPNKCVFLTKDEFGCTVYQHRPIICRLFATIADKRAECKHGCVSIPQLHWFLGIAMTTGWFETMELA